MSESIWENAKSYTDRLRAVYSDNTTIIETPVITSEVNSIIMVDGVRMKFCKRLGFNIKYFDTIEEAERLFLNSEGKKVVGVTCFVGDVEMKRCNCTEMNHNGKLIPIEYETTDSMGNVIVKPTFANKSDETYKLASMCKKTTEIREQIRTTKKKELIEKRKNGTDNSLTFNWIEGMVQDAVSNEEYSRVSMLAMIDLAVKKQDITRLALLDAVDKKYRNV